MKKIFFWSILTLFITTFLPTVLLSQESTSAYDAGSALQHETHVTPAQALNVGYTFMRTGEGSKGNGTKSSSVSKQAMQLVYTGQAYDSLTGNATDCYYVFALQPKGFVIVAADDRVEPILGYSYDNNFVMTNMPDHVRGWLGSYEKQIKEVTKSNRQPEPAIQTKWTRLKSGQSMSTRSGDTVVGPLLTTTWDQGQYYNALCPEDADGPDGHVLTGCVATAMAQIINYWGYPVHGRGTHSYNVSNLDPNSMCNLINLEGYGILMVNYDSATYDYDHMPDVLTASSTLQEIQAVAQLMYHCGVSVNTFYDAVSSGAYEEDIRAALISYFGFAPTLGYANRSLYSDTEWEDSLRANIDRGEPICYTGANIFNAHAFVLDGYKQDGYFHFNFGWSGDCDGWYLTTAIDVGWGYNEWHSAFMGIRPDSNSRSIICQRKMNVENRDIFTVSEPVDLFPLRGNSNYLATNEMTGVRINLNLVPDDSTNQLVLNVLDFDNEQSVVIYDGINKDSVLRVIETRNLDDYTTVTYRTWLYDGSSSDAELQQLAGTDFSPIVSSRHGLTVVVYSYGGMPEGFHLRVRNENDTLYQDTVIEEDRIYWTDIVTSEPEGYLIDGDTIRIASPEGLAWLSRCLDSMWVNGINYNQYYHSVISIENNLDFSGYYWHPIREWLGNIDGNGHIISNLNTRTTKLIGGLFSSLYDAKISNIGILNARVNAINSAAPLVGNIQYCQVVNCWSRNHVVNTGNGQGGGLIGNAWNSQITNCYAYGDIYAQMGYGGLVGYSNNTQIINCVTQNGEGFAWAYQINPPEWRGFITEEVHGGVFSNCFSEISHFSDNVIFPQNRIYAFLGNIYDVDVAKNLAAFNIADDTLCVPIVDVSVNYTLEDNIDVITALNNKVAEYNSPNYRTWVRDSLTHLPVFGDYYEVTCPNVSNITAENIPYNESFAVALSWQENGEAQEWQVKYNVRNAPEDNAVVFGTNTTHDTIQLTLGNEYLFYVRPICGSDTVGWGEPFYFYVDKILWVDVVTTCPDGYHEDANGNVTVSTPEALAWVSKTWWYRQDTIFIDSDLDMGAYRWTPISRYDFRGTIEGNNHIISNLYCTDNIMDVDAEHIGLTGQVTNASFNNIIIKDGVFVGNHYVGSLFGIAWNSTITNCHTMDTYVKGVYDVGGLGGMMASDGGMCVTYNCSSTGSIYADLSGGGLFGAYTTLGTIKNCYSNCEVRPLGVRSNGTRAGFVGGSGGTISNCYSVGIVGTSVSDDIYCGSFLGGFNSELNGEIRYDYTQRQEGLPFVGGSLDPSVLISDTSYIVNANLQTAVTIADTTYTDLLSALNAWVDANDTAGIYRHWAADLTGINGGFPVFAANPCLEINVHDTIVACDNYVWNDSVYTQSGDYTRTFTNASGCDSVVTLHLTISQSFSGVESVSANESYTWADSLYTASGIYEHTWTTAEGCDSTVSLWLTITKTQYDTTYVDVHDTTYIDVHDTTYINIHDTTYIDIHDTTYLWQYDTTYVDVPYPVHDTTYVDVHDTTYLWQYDTTYVDVPYPVHDTTYVTLHDTTVLNHYDTTYIDVPYPVHDTSYVTLTDTIVLNHYDTTYITLHDTITITEPLTWHSLQVYSENINKGVAAGSGQFPEGTNVEIAAIPIEGYRFLKWDDGLTWNPRTITLNGDLTLTAMFTTVGVTDLELPTWYVYPEQGAFVVKGVGDHQVSIYDAAGKLLHRYSDAPDILRYSVHASGAYLIQVDNGAAKKVTVVR